MWTNNVKFFFTKYLCVFYLAYACSPDIYQDSLYEYKLKNIAKPKDGTNEDLIEEVEPSEDALELDTKEDSQSSITPVEEVIMAAHHRRQSRRLSTLLTETAENISSAITNTFITLTGGATEEDMRCYSIKLIVIFIWLFIQM